MRLVINPRCGDKRKTLCDISWCGLVEISPAVPVTSRELKLATVVRSLWKVADSAEESLAGLGTRCWLPAGGHEQVSGEDGDSPPGKRCWCRGR